MLIVKFILLSLYIFLESYFTGLFMSKLLKKQLDTKENIVLGFVTTLAASEFLLWPCVKFKLPTLLFVMLYLSISFIFILLGFIVFFKNRKEFKFGDIQTKELVYKIIFILLIFLQIVLTYIYYRSDADDSFYVSNSCLFKDSKYLNEYDSSLGIENLGTVPMYDFEIWESIITVYSKIINVEPVILAHTLLIPILLIISNLANYTLAKKLFENKIHVYIFCILLNIFAIFGGYSTYSIGSRLLSRIWQGKSIYVCIILPAMISYMLPNSKDKIDKNLYLLVLICILAGICVNPTSLYVIGFQALFLIITLTLCTKNKKYILHLLPGIILTMIFALMLYFNSKSYMIASPSIPKDVTIMQIVNVIKKFFGKNSYIYLIIYLISMIYITKKGTDNQKIYLIYTPLLLFIFILNPISGMYVAKYITKFNTFWRVYWLLPVSSAISTMIILIYSNLKKYNYLAIILGMCLMILPGNFLINSQNGFKVKENFEKLPKDTIEFGKIISNYSKNKLTIATEGINTTLRQKYSNIPLIFSREQYVLDLVYCSGNKEKALEIIKLQGIIDGDTTYIDDTLLLLDKYNIEWIIIKNDNVDVIDKVSNEYTYITKSNENTLLKKIKHE